MACIKKKRGHEEEFSEAKIFESCIAACLQSGFGFDEAERVSSRVASRVKSWAGRKKQCIPSAEVSSKVIQELKGLEAHGAAYAYEHIMDLS
jgi:transcriptional regulator NrdR family protein